MKPRAKSWKQWPAVSLLSCAGLALAAFAALAAPAPDDPRLVDAVRQGDRDAVRSLLAERVDVNAPQPDGSTALAWAAHRNDLDTAEMWATASSCSAEIRPATSGSSTVTKPGWR